MAIGFCKLCNEQRELHSSHIVPAFVFRWLKRTAPTPHLRSAMTPNRRVQDGETREWLCSACERLFSGWEKSFAERLFEPYAADSSCKVSYDAWLLKFCVSLSWRTLIFYRSLTDLEHYSVEQLDAAEQAERAWREFLLGQAGHPGQFRQELLPLDIIESHRGDLVLSPNINQYLTRAIAMDVIAGKRSSYVMTKIGRFAIFGHLLVENPKGWKGTNVRVNGGWILPRDFDVPFAIGEYLNEKAVQFGTVLSQISPDQRKKLDASIAANVDKIEGSDWWRSARRDFELQGYHFDN